MKTLDEMIQTARVLRNPTLPRNSVMTQLSAPAWQPEYEKEPPLEQVSPEDFIPNPKSVVAALKGAPAMFGVGALKDWSPKFIEKLGVKEAATPGHFEGTFPSGRLTLPESTMALHNANFLRDEKRAAKKLVPPPPEVIDRINAAGNTLHGAGGTYLPYKAEGADYKEVPLSTFLTKHVGKANLKQMMQPDTGSATHAIGIQGIAHGVREDGTPIAVDDFRELLNGPSYVAAYTDSPNQTIWKITPDIMSLEDLWRKK